jgi:BirA family biotin operon repressor/biotin-[acetyl-CoA-carboxylase] ligase
VGLAETVERHLGPRSDHVQIKWPNDLCLNGEKFAGILVEMAPAQRRSEDADLAIIGIGLNVNQDPSQLAAVKPTEASRGATSIKAYAGRTIARLALLGDAIASLDEYLNEGTAATLVEGWRQRSALLHQDVTLENGGTLISGQVVDLHPHEGLIVRTREGALTHLPAASTTLIAG